MILIASVHDFNFFPRSLDDSAVAIEEELVRCTGGAPARLAALQGALKCGTNCGSCMQQLQKLVKVSVTPITA